MTTQFKEGQRVGVFYTGEAGYDCTTYAVSGTVVDCTLDQVLIRIARTSDPGHKTGEQCWFDLQKPGNSDYACFHIKAL